MLTKKASKSKIVLCLRCAILSLLAHVVIMSVIYLCIKCISKDTVLFIKNWTMYGGQTGVRTVTVRGTSAVRPFVVWLRPPSFVSKNRNKRQRGETSKESAVRRKFVILLHMTVNKLQERCCLLPSQTASWLSPDTSLLRVLLKK